MDNKTEVILILESEPLFKSGKKWSSFQRFTNGYLHRLYMSAENQDELIQRATESTVHPEMLSFQTLLHNDSGALTLPWVLFGLVGYVLFHMVSTGVFQALTALQVR